MCVFPGFQQGLTPPVESHTPDLCEMSIPSLQPQLRSPRSDPLWLPWGPAFGLRGSGSGRHTPSLPKQPFEWFNAAVMLWAPWSFFFFLIFYVFLFDCAGSLLLRWLSLVAMRQELLFLPVHGLLIAVASLVVEHLLWGTLASVVGAHSP